MLFHQRLQIDHGVGAVLGVVAEFAAGFSLFKDALQDHAIERPMAHPFVMLDEIGFSVLGEIDRLALAQAIVAYQCRAPLL